MLKCGFRKKSFIINDLLQNPRFNISIKNLHGVPKEYLDIVRDYWGEYEKIDQGNLDGIDSYKMREFYQAIALMSKENKSAAVLLLLKQSF